MRSPQPHETIVSQREIDHQDYRSRNLISTPGAVIISLDTQPLSPQDVEYIESHATYAMHPISLTDAVNRRFTTSDDIPMTNIFVRAEDLVATLATTPAAKTVYLV